MTAQDSEQCHRCKHRSVIYASGQAKYGDYIFCYYIGDEGHSRGCQVENCDKFEEGKPKRRTREF